ncbi:MAG: AAA family ATPase [Chloroflexota bacterium]
MTARIYTMVNQKGGVGKTTTAINLGAYLAKAGQRVLIVDLDPQANATSCLGVDKNTVKHGTYEALLGITSASNSLLTNATLGLTILPSSPALAGAEVELVTQENRDSRLKHALEKVAEKFDYILIDCPPSLSLLTINGLIAARDGVIIPVQCEYLALEGVGQLLQTLARIRQSLFPALKVRGVVMTMYESRAHLSTDVVGEIRKHFPDQVFDAIVPRSIRLAEAPSYGLPISIYAPSSTGAQAYSALAKELLAGDGVSNP